MTRTLTLTASRPVLSHLPRLSLRQTALAAALALAPALAWSQASAAEAKDGNDTLNLNRVVVTGTAVGASKMKQSVSISTLEADQIIKLSPSNAAEILRAIPGIRSESSGGEGNANLTVRGLPISAGGARYVQFQEDGLPILLFGDIAFGTADQFLRTDYNLSHLEVIRGGSASTLASNSPGGIVNFISKTGDEPGGAAGLTLGLDGGRQTRLDFDYGNLLGNGTKFHIGGFQRVGEGDRKTGFNAASGGQIKANITQDFSAGYLRLNLKLLDDKTPSFMPVPVSTVGGKISPIGGIDPRSAFFINNSTPQDVVFGADGKMVSTNPRDGLQVRSTAIGLEGAFKLGDGWSISDKFRHSTNSGRFIAMFPADNGTPTAGAAKFTATMFNTSIDDLGNTVNDLKLSKTFGDVAGGKTTASAGLFSARQNVALTWEAGALTLDGSVRQDSQTAKGWAQQDNPVTKTWDASTRQTVNYKLSHTSYSLGGNYQLNKDLALFARASDGVAFSADRLLYGSALDGSVPVASNTVRQIEGGAKLRAGAFSLFATAFNAKTKESNYEATTRKFTSNDYNANGLELELGYRLGGFKLTGGGTFTKAEITASNVASTVGKTPRRQADFVFQLAPSYAIGPIELGAAIIGTGKSWGDDANTIVQPAYTVLNAFVNYQVNDRISVSASANNLTNTLGYTEVEGDGHAARAINGRTVKMSLRYAF